MSGSPTTPTTARYVAFEGAEGCGKSSQAARLAAALDAVLTRETGGTEIGRRIRAILHDTAVTDLAARAEALLTAADRAQHLEQVVLPALGAGRHVVSDRSVHSSLAYQGFGRELPIDDVRRVNDWAIGGRWPDLVILLDVAPERLAERMRGRDLDRFEQESDDFHSRVLDGFHRLAASDPEHWVVLDGNGTEEHIAATVRDVVRTRWGI